MEVTVKLGANDWLVFNRHQNEKLKAEAKTLWDHPVISTGVWIILALAAIYLFEQFFVFDWPTAIATTAFILFAVGVAVYKISEIQKAAMPSDDGTFCGTHQFKFDEAGISTKGTGFHSFHQWASVKEIEHARDMTLIFLDTSVALIIPDSQIDDPAGLFKIITSKYNASQ